MGTRRYGISPWVFNSIAHESDIDLNTRRELITYLQETMYSIVFYINTVGLYWQEKSTLLINKKHRIHNPRKKKSQSTSAIFGDKAQDEKTLWISTKTKNRGRWGQGRRLRLDAAEIRTLKGFKMASTFNRPLIHWKWKRMGRERKRW